MGMKKTTGGWRIKERVGKKKKKLPLKKKFLAKKKLAQPQTEEKQKKRD